MNNQPLSIFTFPIWWYSEGLNLAWLHCKSKYQFVLRSTGLIIFIKNIAQPLYGDTTRQGRIISIFIRVVLFFFLVLWSGLRIAFVFLQFLLHLLILPLAIVMLIYQLFSIFS